MSFESTVMQLVKDKGVVLAAVPFAGSFIAFAFEGGYLVFYDIPVTYVQLDFVRIVTASAALLIALAVVALVFGITSVSGREHPLYRVLAGGARFVALVGALLFLIPNGGTLMPLALSLAVGFMLLTLLGAVPSGKTKLTYWQRLSKQLNEQGRSEGKGGTPDLVDELLLTPLAALAFIGLLAMLLGHYTARTQESYWALDEAPDMIVVTNYGDTLLLKRVDTVTKQVKGDLVVQKITGTTPAKLRKRYIDGLKSEPKPKKDGPAADT